MDCEVPPQPCSAITSAAGDPDRYPTGTYTRNCLSPTEMLVVVPAPAVRVSWSGLWTVFVAELGGGCARLWACLLGWLADPWVHAAARSASEASAAAIGALRVRFGFVGGFICSTSTAVRCFWAVGPRVPSQSHLGRGSTQAASPAARLGGGVQYRWKLPATVSSYTPTHRDWTSTSGSPSVFHERRTIRQGEGSQGRGGAALSDDAGNEMLSPSQAGGLLCARDRKAMR